MFNDECSPFKVVKMSSNSFEITEEYIDLRCTRTSSAIPLFMVAVGVLRPGYMVGLLFLIVLSLESRI